uniref:Mitochondrial pyruvate carrier n=1 Tax=Vitis vinifera TaxID=29760 RepID=A5BCM7_VITVI|nr:hypothetical protein VITISV_018795 [Vitis vinifera]
MAASKFQALWNHPVGPKTIHFWAPTFKWGLSIANAADFSKPPEELSYPLQFAVACSGLIWSRYCTVITPRNWNLLGVNAAMAGTGVYQLSRKIWVLFRSTRTLLAQGRTSSLLAPQSHLNTFLIGESTDKVVATQVSLLHHLVHNASIFQRFGISSSASPQTNEKETTQSGNEQGTVENDGAPADAEPAKTNQAEESGYNSKPQSESVKRRRRGTKRTAFSDSDSEADLSMDDLMKLVVEKEELLKMKNKEIEKMQDKVLRSYAEMENVMERARREAENSKKFAIQNFAKSLLDVADNLGRASLVVKESFSKIDESKDTAGAVPLLKTLLEGVEMTEKQLGEVFRKFGMEKFDPTNEQFDPHRHNAAFQIPDPSKPSGTVAVVLKAGYMLHDRVIRPAEVGVTQAVDNNETEA